MSGRALAAEVTTPSGYIVEPTGAVDGQEPVAVLAAIDLGIKSRTPWQFAERGVRVHVLPQSTTLSEILALRPDGVLFSNGPGDPGSADAETSLLRGVLDAHIPSSASAWATSSWDVPWATAPTSSPTGIAGSTSPFWTVPPARWRSRPTTTASPSTYPLTSPPWPPSTTAATVGWRSPTWTQRRCRRGATRAGPAGLLRPVPPRGRGRPPRRRAPLRPIHPPHAGAPPGPGPRGHELTCLLALISPPSWSSGRDPSSSGRPASSTTPGPRPAESCALRESASSWSTPTRPRS